MTIAIAVRVVLTVALLKRRRLRAFTTEVKKDRAVLSLSLGENEENVLKQIGEKPWKKK